MTEFNHRLSGKESDSEAGDSYVYDESIDCRLIKRVSLRLGFRF